MALRLEDVLEMWKTDSEIDELKLDEASQESARLHAKYLEMLSVTRLQLKKKEAEFKTLLLNKWKQYHGKLSKDELDELGWEYDPLNGLKVLKGDMDKFFDADPEIQNSQMRIDYLKELVATLEEIINNIRWRHQNIKNMIEHRKFTSGI
jgi:hypothetical protein